MNESNQALWDVVRVALVCMMCVQIFGVYFNALFPKLQEATVYECDFTLKEHMLTMPCTIRGKWNE